LRELAYSLQVTSLEPVQNEQQRGDERQQKAQKPHYRHLVFLKAPVESAFSRDLVFLVTPRTLLFVSLAQHLYRPVRVSPYLVAHPLGRFMENP